MGKNNDKEGAPGPMMQVPFPVEVVPEGPKGSLICPFMSGGTVMAMHQVTQSRVLSAGPPQQSIVQQPVRYHMLCAKDKCAIWDGENECCGLLTVNAEMVTE